MVQVKLFVAFILAAAAIAPVVAAPADFELPRPQAALKNINVESNPGTSSGTKDKDPTSRDTEIPGSTLASEHTYPPTPAANNQGTTGSTTEQSRAGSSVPNQGLPVGARTMKGPSLSIIIPKHGQTIQHSINNEKKPVTDAPPSPNPLSATKISEIEYKHTYPPAPPAVKNQGQPEGTSNTHDSTTQHNRDAPGSSVQNQGRAQGTQKTQNQPTPRPPMSATRKPTRRSTRKPTFKNRTVVGSGLPASPSISNCLGIC